MLNRRYARVSPPAAGRQRVIPIIGLVVALVASTLHAETEPTPLDTTRVRTPEPVRKSTGEILADIPGEILKFPFYTLETLTFAVATHPPVSEISRVIRIGAEIQPYVPVVGYGSRSGVKFGFGLRVLKPIIPPDHIRGKWYYSTHRYQSYQVAVRQERFFGSRLGFDLFARYRKRPRESFFGVGMSSRERNETNYTLEHMLVEPEVLWRAHPRLQVSLIAGYQAANLYDGRDPNLAGDLDATAADPEFNLDPGRFDGSRFVSFGASLHYDGRDNRGQPSRGGQATGRYTRLVGINRSDGLNFSRWSLDLRYFQNLWRKRILALRAYVQRLRADTDNPRAAPIHLVSTLGGIDALRGYSRGRFIDNDLAMISMEYRYPVYRSIDAFVFLDEGRVYDDITKGVLFEGWTYSTGFGIRAWNTEEVTVAALVARSRESTRVYLELGAIW